MKSYIKLYYKDDCDSSNDYLNILVVDSKDFAKTADIIYECKQNYLKNWADVVDEYGSLDDYINETLKEHNIKFSYLDFSAEFSLS